MVTALSYFAAVALMTSAKLALWQWLPLLLVYNAIFIAPSLLRRFERWRESLQRGARETLLWIVAIAGVALAGDAVGRFTGKRGDLSEIFDDPSLAAAPPAERSGQLPQRPRREALRVAKSRLGGRRS
jgi:hypothetical protein